MSMFIWIVLASAVLVGARDRPPPQSADDLQGSAAEIAATDFAIFRDAVSDQNSRLDSLDATLGVIAALCFAILTVPHRTDGLLTRVPALGSVASVLLSAAIAGSLFAAIAFRGSVGPRLDLMVGDVQRDRAGVYRADLKLLGRDYARNTKLIQTKLAYLRASMLTGAVATLVITLTPMIR